MNETFQARLGHCQRLVEARLAEVIAETGSVPARLAAAMRHAVLGGGKRFRPFLVIEGAGLFGMPHEAALDTAAALELVHCYSLVHDDLPAMDDDRTRRGRPTVWVAFDEWTAVLAGDALLTMAFEVLSRPSDGIGPAVRGELVHALAVAAGRNGMVGGQQLDLEAEKRGEPPRPDVHHIRRLQSMKTGALITFAAEAGAILAGAAQVDRAALRRYGAQLGYAFQIADDLLDATGDAATVGKAVAKDADAGKVTLVALMGIEAARRHLAEVEAAAISELQRFGARAASLIEAARFVSARSS